MHNPCPWISVLPIFGAVLEEMFQVGEKREPLLPV